LLFEAMSSIDDDGSILFHYALTLWIQGNVRDARTQLTKAINQGYRPSHELYVLRDQIPSDLEDAIEWASGKAQRPIANRTCPSPPT
jgi:hypothetical protein